MTIKLVAPHGEWQSPISVESVASGSRAVTAPRVCNATGRTYFLEDDGAGRMTIMELSEECAVDILPQEYSVGNTVYEYGVTALNILPDGRLIFSNKDNTVGILDPNTCQVVTVLEDNPALRYGAFEAHKTSPWVLAIQEDHTINTPYSVQNYIVAINIENGNVKRVISGADFYFQPQFNSDGTRLVWLEWNHPEMLFEMSKLCGADWDTDNVAITNKHLISGGNSDGTCEPHWGTDDALYFSKETGDHRQLFRIPPTGGEPVHLNFPGLEKFDIGESTMSEASRTYVSLSSRYLLATATSQGVSCLILIDIKNGNWKTVAQDQGISALRSDCVARVNEYTGIVVGRGPTLAGSLFKIDIHDARNSHLVRTSGLSASDYPRGLVSMPESISIASRSESRQAHGFLYMPRNNKFMAAHGTLPPLVIQSHGGPTGSSANGFSLQTQYFTSRGYAFLLVNYVGSTGYGREYRRHLYGRWGISDTNDVADFAAHLVETGRVRPGAVGITGGSAGGYNTLQALTRYPTTFAGGVCLCGISDLALLDKTTHKLESDYTTALALPKGTPKEDAPRIYEERSALYHAEKIASPLLLLHGIADTVVPIAQARKLHDIVKQKGGDIKLVEFPDEGHMLAKPDTVRSCIAEEELWWRKTLLKM